MLDKKEKVLKSKEKKEEVKTETKSEELKKNSNKKDKLCSWCFKKTEYTTHVSAMRELCKKCAKKYKIMEISFIIFLFIIFFGIILSLIISLANN